MALLKNEKQPPIIIFPNLDDSAEISQVKGVVTLSWCGKKARCRRTKRFERRADDRISGCLDIGRELGVCAGVGIGVERNP